jgi:steroid delta-isomerase-like uncharacterized protein
MLPELNKALVQQWYEEAWNRGKPEVADVIFADNYVDHAAPSATGIWPLGSEGARRSMALLRDAFPDIQHTVVTLIAEGEYVAARVNMTGTHRGEFMAISPTGREVVMAAVAMFRILNDKIVESWGQFDMLDVLQQIGAAPAPQQPGPETPSPAAPSP